MIASGVEEFALRVLKSAKLVKLRANVLVALVQHARIDFFVRCFVQWHGDPNYDKILLFQAWHVQDLSASV